MAAAADLREADRDWDQPWNRPPALLPHTARCETCQRYAPTSERLGVCLVWSLAGLFLMRLPEDRCRWWSGGERAWVMEVNDVG